MDGQSYSAKMDASDNPQKFYYNGLEQAIEQFVKSALLNPGGG